MARRSSGMKRSKGRVQRGASTSMAAAGCCWRNAANRLWAMTISPTQAGPTTRMGGVSPAISGQIVVDAALGTNDAGLDRLLQPREIDALAAAILGTVPEMQHRHRPARRAAPAAAIQQPLDEVAVLKAPAPEILVEAVDRQKILAPGREVAGLGTFPARLWTAPIHQAQHGCQAIHLAREPRR